MMKAWMKELWNSPVFICGYYRSGTSLLMALLDGHPDLVVNVNESFFFQTFLSKAEGKSFAELASLAQETILSCWDSEDWYYEKYLTHIPVEEMQDAFLSMLDQGEKSLSDYLTAAILAYGEVSSQLDSSVRYWVEKTPTNEHFANLIFSWWDNPRCIHVVRDPRDMHTSHRQRSLRKSGSATPIEESARNWLDSVRRAQENIEDFGRARYLLVRYEDLVFDTEKQISHIASFLGIDEDEILYQPTRAGGVRSYKGNSLTGEEFIGISTAPVGRWKGILPEKEVAVLEGLLEAEMQRYGYELEEQRAIADRARVRVARFRIARARIRSWILRKANLGRDVRTLRALLHIVRNPRCMLPIF